MSLFYDTLLAGAPQLTAQTLEVLEKHWRLVEAANAKMNLTAIRDEAEAASKHYLDSLLILPFVKGRRALDIGSGAGFPGMPLAVCMPQINWYLLDSTGKKCLFMEDCATQLALDNVAVLNLRAEEAGRDLSLRSSFDTVTARAVAPLNVLLEYALPLLRRGGVFVAMKGPAFYDEINEAAAAMQKLRADLWQTQELSLPSGDTRVIACFKKQGETPAQYPRAVGKPQKQPL